MTDFINSMIALFDFLTSQLSNIASFFTTSTLGIVILSMMLFSVVVNVLLSFFKK